MRTAQNQNLMHTSESGHAKTTATEELSACSTTAVRESYRTTLVKPQGIARVPTHAVRPVEERRAYIRAKISLPIRVKRIAGQKWKRDDTLRTSNISSSGVLFTCPQRIEPGTPVEIEVCLVDRPLGRGSVHMVTEAHVVRTEASIRTDWHVLALSFDDITFQRDEPLPSRFLRH
jgi:PilZ domain